LKLKAIRFRYRKGISETNFETLPFYLYTLRNLLQKHVGDVVWLKGGIIEQPAYLIYKVKVEPAVIDALSKPLEEQGVFEITAVQYPQELIEKYKGQERVAVGYLDLGPAGKLGSLESLSSKTGLDYKEGFWLNKNTMLKADGAYIVMAERKNPVSGKIEEAPMVILLNVTELVCDDEGKIISVEVKPKYGVWLDVLTKIAEKRGS